MKFIFSFFFCLVFCLNVFSCDCPDLEKINLSVCSKYSAIARVKIDKLGECSRDKRMVFFEVLDLYKGKIEKQDWFWLDCATQCSFIIEEGDEWIVYLKKNNAQELLLNFCGHSRKLIPSDLEDYQTEIVGLTYNEEIKFLENNFDVNSYYQEGIKPRSYQKVSSQTTLILLIVGLVTMLAALLISKRFF